MVTAAPTSPASPSSIGTDFPGAVFLFGELLADCFPDREIPGGAPFNVAHHLCGLAGSQVLRPLLISRIGRDARASRLLAACQAAGLSTEGIQHDEQRPSGRVEVTFSQTDGLHRFDIPPQQAWDFIDGAACEALLLAHRPRLIYFGTLAQRSNVSRAALKRLLSRSRTDGFLDVNLRPPWVGKDVLHWSLNQADTLKLNEDELAELATLFSPGDGAPQAQAERLARQFRIRCLLVTRGARGAWLFEQERGWRESAVASSAVPVVDTVGAGDAFSAIFLLGLQLKWSPADCLERANQFAAAVCGLRGAVPSDADFYLPWRQRWGLQRKKPA